MRDWSQERRGEPRFPAYEPATANLISSPTAIGGWVINVSHSGLKLALTEPVTVGVLIQVTMKNLLLTGEVRYCTPAEGRFHAGVCVHEARLVPTYQYGSIPV